MVVNRTSGDIDHRSFRDFPEIVESADCLVINKTRVLPARFGVRRATGGRLDGLFVSEQAAGRWRVLLSGVRRIRADEALAFVGGPWTLEVVSRGARGLCEVCVSPPDSAERILSAVGRAPLPPYIKRQDDPDADARDLVRYQTVYAETAGSIAAPTAGLHFTEALLERLSAQGTATAQVTLHVGLGTFAPIEVADLRDHPMHRERFDLTEDDAEIVRHTRRGGGRIVAVGTTSVRVLETCADEHGLHARSDWTDLLIYPPFAFRATDALLTNFHLPGSTLLALVLAFGGRELMLRAYECAVREGYRFYSYGDAMLIV